MPFNHPENLENVWAVERIPQYNMQTYVIEEARSLWEI